MWVKIKQNPNYSVNEQGQVRNDVTGHIKKPTLNKKSGYLVVDLYMNNKGQKIAIHRLVAEAFIPNPEDKPCIDHKNGNRQDNRIENLRWATYSENNSRFNSLGVRSQRVTVTHYIEKRKKRGGGHEAWLGIDSIKQYDSVSKTAEAFGVSVSNISLMLDMGTIGRRGKMRGYKFEYTDSERITL